MERKPVDFRQGWIFMMKPKVFQEGGLPTAMQRSILAGIVLAIPVLATAGPDDIPVRKAVQGDAIVDQARADLRKDRVNAHEFRNLRFLNRVVVTLEPQVDPTLFGISTGMRPMIAYPNRVFVFETATVAHAANMTRALRGQAGVAQVYQDAILPVAKRQFVPNDPFYPFGTTNGQWHLRNTNNIGSANIDARLWGAWQANRTGNGVTIGILDDSVEIGHEDLSPNISAADSYDFGQNDTDPSPVHSNDEHGIAVAGVAAARGGNSIGVTGAAPNARIAGIRMDFNAPTLSMFVNAVSHRSTGATPTIQIKNHSYGYVSPWVNAVDERDAMTTSTNAGTIHIWAAGNDRGTVNQDTGKALLQGHPNSISVAALGANGRFSSYSSFGAPVFVTAPSSGNVTATTQIGIMTTDRSGESFGYNGGGDPLSNSNYTQLFGGTSSAAPLVAGVAALVKQAQPALNTRFLKHLLARHSIQVDATDATTSSDGGWKTNGAGLKFNQNYGFGLIDAGTLVTEAVKYSGVTNLVTTTTGTVNVAAAIPDHNDSTGSNGVITRTFNVTSTTPLEEVTVNLNVTHSFRGDLEGYITSPSGLKSRLFIRSGSDGSTGTLNWPFTTNAFWGENPAGTWTIELRDTFASDTGTWNSFNVTMRQGELVPVIVNTHDAEFVSDTFPANVFAGRTYNVNVTMKNTGTSTWTRADGFVLVANPVGTTTWTTTFVRLGTLDSIAPGQSKTFSFPITAPATTGTFNYQWRMSRPGNAVFGQATTNRSVTVQSGHFAEFVSQTLPATIQPGRQYTATVVMRNGGTTTWSRDAGFVLVAQNPLGNTTWGTNNVKLGVGETVAPGATKSFQFTITAPSTAGSYNWQWRMSRPSNAVFGEFTPNLSVNVQVVNNAQFISQTGIPTTIQAGQTFTASITMRNNGNSTWTRSAGYILLAQNPFGNSTWGMNQVRLGSSESIAAGTDKTFTATFRAPTTPGTYNFQWRMRHGMLNDNFGDFSPNVSITVTP